MKFFTNLRPQSITAFEAHDYEPKAWLLSTHRLNEQTLKHALDLRKRGVPLFSDNGTKQLIDKTMKKFRKKAGKISKEIAAIKEELGHHVKENDLPLDIKQKSAKLARKVIRKCVKLSEKLDWEELLEDQLSMKPTHLIAQEDFATACLIGLNLEREYTGLSKEELAKRNLRSLKLWDRVANDSRCKKIKVYAVLSGMDHETALDAGKLAARKGATHVAWGIASIMLDMNTVDFYRVGKSETALEKPVRRRFVRFAEIIRGLVEGYEVEGKRLEGFHGLGLGAPILFPILALEMDPDTEVTIDSTSPILNAVRLNTLFDPERDGDRVSFIKIVERILDGGEWSFLCPFCKKFRADFGYKPDAARKWWVDNGKPKITNKDLEAGKPLSKMVPLFTKHEKPSMVDNCRISHNHWVIEHFLDQVPLGDGRISWAEKKIDEMISYETTSTEKSLRVMKEILLDKK